MKWIRIIIAAGMLITGLLIYPYYVQFVLTPLRAIVDSLEASGTLPALNLFESTFLSALPLVLLLTVAGIAIMNMAGRVGGGIGGDDHAVY